MKKIYNCYVCLIFIVTIISLPLYYIIFRPVKVSSLLESRLLNQFTPFSVVNFLSGNFQDNFEKAFVDQVPKRDTILLVTAKFNRLFGRVSYMPFTNDSYPLYISDSPYLHYYKGKKLLIAPPSRFYSNVNEGIKNELNKYNAIIEENRDTRFFTSLIEPIYNSYVNPLNSFFENPVNGRYLKTFYEYAPDSMVLTVIEPNNIDEYMSYFYTTDHHLKAAGVLKIYNDLYEKLSNDILNFPSKIQVNSVIQIKQAPFMGSFARRGLYSGLTEYLEDIDTSDIKLSIYIEGEKSKRNNKEKVLNGGLTSPFTNYYAEYFGDDEALVIYENLKPSERNLLLIGPSYTQPVEQLLAYHYLKTYVIDLRHYSISFNLSSFIKDNKIDDVILMIEPQLLSDPVWQMEK